MIKDQLKKKQERSRLGSDGVFDYLTSLLLKKYLFYALDQDYCLLKIPKPVCERIFEQTKHQIDVASELTVFSYLNVSSVIPQGKRHFLPSESILGKP